MVFLYTRMSTFHVKLHCKSEVSTKYNIKLCINCTSTLNGFLYMRMQIVKCQTFLKLPLIGICFQKDSFIIRTGCQPTFGLRNIGL